MFARAAAGAGLFFDSSEGYCRRGLGPREWSYCWLSSPGKIFLAALNRKRMVGGSVRTE